MLPLAVLVLSLGGGGWVKGGGGCELKFLNFLLFLGKFLQNPMLAPPMGESWIPDHSCLKNVITRHDKILH